MYVKPRDFRYSAGRALEGVFAAITVEPSLVMRTDVPSLESELVPIMSVPRCVQASLPESH